MSCEWVREAVDPYLAGRLLPAECEALERHVATCESCARDLEASTLLLREVARLPRELPPQRELWGGVARRIRPAARRVGPWLAAAMLLLAAAIGLLGRSGTPRVMPGADIAALTASYQSAAQELEPSLAAVAASAPRVAESVHRQLQTLETAIAETGAALSKDPDNAALKTLTLSAHRKKLELLRWAVALGAES